METSHRDETLINCIIQEINEHQSDLCLYKKWYGFCESEVVKASFHALITSVENRLYILYKEINEKLSA